MRLRCTAVLAALVMALTACGSESVPITEDTATSAPVVTQEVPGAASPTNIPTISAEGANAAPTIKFFDSSQQAANDFGAWWRYEIQSRDDEQRGVQQAYEDGIAACGMRYRGAGTEASLVVIERDLGWTGGGAAAIYAAALRTLCTQFDFGVAQSDGTINGYKTYFDKQVNLTYPLVIQAVQPFSLSSMPNRIDVGWLGKFTCAYMAERGTSVGLLDYLQANSNMMSLAAGPPALAQATAKQTVTHMCPAHMGSVLTW